MRIEDAVTEHSSDFHLTLLDGPGGGLFGGCGHAVWVANTPASGLHSVTIDAEIDKTHNGARKKGLSKDEDDAHP